MKMDNCVTGDIVQQIVQLNLNPAKLISVKKQTGKVNCRTNILLAFYKNVQVKLTMLAVASYMEKLQRPYENLDNYF